MPIGIGAKRRWSVSLCQRGLLRSTGFGRLTFSGQVPHRRSFQLDAVCAVGQPIEEGVSVGWVADALVPFLRRYLTRIHFKNNLVGSRDVTASDARSRDEGLLEEHFDRAAGSTRLQSLVHQRAGHAVIVPLDTMLKMYDCAAQLRSTAGIEASYADVKSLTNPAAEF